MIEIERNLMKHLPYLHVVKGKGKHAQLPVVVFLHGFTSAKEHNLHYAYLLAERGMRVILPEANLHGERSQGVNEDTLPFQFWEIVTTTINELALIKEQLHVQGWGTDRIGLAGTSMGGITLLGALTQYDWIKVGVCLMGSPHYEQFAQNKLNELLKLGVKLPYSIEELNKQIKGLEKFDLSKQREALAGRPLLFWHGQKDQVVPFQPTYDFYKEVEQDYAHDREKLAFIVEPQAEHKVSRTGVLKTVDWFAKHL